MCHCNVKLVSSRPIPQLWCENRLGICHKKHKSAYLPSTSAENPVGSSLPRLPSSKTATLTSVLAKMTWGRLPPWNMQMKSISIQLCVSYNVAININHSGHAAGNTLYYTTLQSMVNAKLSKQRFWHCYENGLIKTIQPIPHNLYVSIKLTPLWIKAYPGLS